MNKSKRKMIVFTGGHHSSALAVALELKKRGCVVEWIGHKSSMWKDTSPSAEYLEVTKAGINFTDLKAGKLYHTLSPAKLVRVPLGIIQAFVILLRLKIKYGNSFRGIVTFGGYLGVPVVLSGWMLGIPTVAHEQTYLAGWANKFISFFSRNIAVSWPASLEQYPGDKVVLTGLPIRREILAAANSQTGITPKRIYITGGKQGSHIINKSVFSIIERLTSEYEVWHQTGSSSLHHDYEKALDIKKGLPFELGEKYQVFTYLDPQKTAEALSSSEVVISRSGAHITYELALFKARCVLIPIPWSSHDEQNKQAELLAQHGQAVILPQTRLNGESLMDSIKLAAKLKPDPPQIFTDGLERVTKLIYKSFDL